MEEFEDILEMRQKNKLMEYVVINAVTKVTKTKGCEISDLWPEVIKARKWWRIQLTLNGVELPVTETFEEIEKQFDNMVKNEAKRIVDEKINDRFEDIDEVLTDISEQANTLLKNLLEEE